MPDNNVKVIISSSHLTKILQSLNLEEMQEETIIEIGIENQLMKINGIEMSVENKSTGIFEVRAYRLLYLLGILKKIQDSPIVLHFVGDSLYLSEVYI